MSDSIHIKSKAIPSNPRSKNYPAGVTVVRSGASGDSTVVTGGGTDIDVIKENDLRSLTDRNVLSSLRTLLEIKSRIIALQDSNTPLSDENTFSSLRTLAEILKRIIAKDDKDSELSDENTFSSLRTVQELENLFNKAKDTFLNKLYPDTAAGHIDFEKGLTSKELIEANNGLVVRNEEIVEVALTSLVEEGTDSLIEELAVTDPPVGGPTTLGGLENVSDDVDVAVSGSLFVKGANWEAVPPALSSLTDYENMLMPVYHQVLGKWVFISVSSITGGVTPPPVLEMVLDTGVLDVNKLA